MVSKKVLLVDDSRAARELVKGNLARAGYEVFCAENGRKGLKAFRKHDPQVVITDLLMPEMDGVAFLTELGIKDDNSKVAIVLTGQDSDDSVEKCFRLGIQNFLRKPVSMYELIGLVRRSFYLIENATALNTALKQVETLNHFLKLTVDALAEGVVVVDGCFRVKLVSSEACRILQIEEKNALGKTAVAMLGASVGGPTGEIMNCERNNKNIYGQHLRIFCPSGLIVPVSLSVISLASLDSHSGWLLIMRDSREEERQIREDNRGSRFGRFIGTAPSITKIFDQIEMTARTQANVLIMGETGTGKELVALELHERSFRAQKPFHAVNCAAISGELLASELFGHEKGSFTGATHSKPGRFELARGGTLFLDEIGEIPLEFQGKLLRVLQEKCFERVGGTKQIKTDFRLVTATNRNLRKMVDESKFREDLYYRLHVVPIVLPPLRERAQDIPLLVRHFIREFNQLEGRAIEHITQETLSMLLDYPWLGNIRELKNAIEYSFTLSHGTKLEVTHFPDLIKYEAQGEIPILNNEREMTLWALQQANFNKSKAAALLGINRTTLYRREKKYDFEKES